MSQATIPTTMKSGTSKTALAAEMIENNDKESNKGITRSEKNEFLEAVSMAIENGPEAGNALPEIEVPRKVIEHFNRSNMNGFDDIRYFVYHNVRVYEEGKRDISKKQERMTMEDKTFGGYRR